MLFSGEEIKEYFVLAAGLSTVLIGLDTGPIIFGAVPVWARTWLLEDLLHF